MPDETNNAPAAQETPSQLEQLMAEAENAVATPVTDHPRPCSHTSNNDLAKQCPTCLFYFCPDCGSVLDPQYCHLCLPVTEGVFQTEPLKDVDGVTHEGRVMHPNPNGRFFQPRFGTLAKTISEMRDNELEEYIKYYQNLVKQAETALDFRRVVLGSSQLELAQRNDTKRRILRADKNKYPVKTLTVAKDGSGKKKTASTGDLLKMLEMLKQIDANRAKKAKESQS